jgi:hypothetical protein
MSWVNGLVNKQRSGNEHEMGDRLIWPVRIRDPDGLWEIVVSSLILIFYYVRAPEL